jgi:pimeloyl-ACP methyl ester carboxylesterase
MDRVTSKDGTSIAYESMGAGPALVLVGGGLDDGSENAPLAGELAQRFTVYNYARRGRGDSGATRPYAVQREIEDIDALVAVAGGTAHLYGVSSGGALALEAAAARIAVDKLAVYEVPYNMADDWPQRWREYTDARRSKASHTWPNRRWWPQSSNSSSEPDQPGAAGGRLVPLRVRHADRHGFTLTEVMSSHPSGAFAGGCRVCGATPARRANPDDDAISRDDQHRRAGFGP